MFHSGYLANFEINNKSLLDTFFPESSLSFEEYYQQKSLTYAYKKYISGNNQERLKKTLNSLFIGAQKLKQDSQFKEIYFNTSKLNLLINDRTLSANTLEKKQNIEKELQTFFNSLNWETIQYTFDTDKQHRLQVTIDFKNNFDLDRIK